MCVGIFSAKVEKMFYKLALISDKYLQEREIFSNFVHNMKDEEFFLQKLQHHDIKPTANRLMILRAMWRGDEAVSLTQLEHILLTIDKSTISRTLNLFLLNGLIHAIDDGSGSVKYAVDGDLERDEDEEHTHFACVKCGRTFCLKQVHVPEVPLPPGFKLQSVNYVLKGLCPECAIK